ncbi:AbrB family transcriptional regulator [Pseudomonas citronellolis]|uniref:AbrB family transcriptional regulator n=1 Tax=Pseudomonas citronellolis TaxID=53408 RepID=UPI0021C052D2|nr:AbrB family transcriptional regulator [Pseudomonas citronellolis]UXJ54531.1 AbrB family transcriptional regulator [Pseudomonas citronellolis]
MSSPQAQSLSRIPASLQWPALILAAGGAGQLLAWLGIPAALFLGPMLVAIAFGVGGAGIRLPRQAFRLSQGCIGLLVAHAINWSVLQAMAASWPLMLCATLLTLLLSALVSYAMVRFGGIPGSTAAWGTAPGGAAAMVAMAESHGADPRVVATMQYVRVVCVVMAGALVGRLLGLEGGGSAAHSTPLNDAGHLPDLVNCLLLIFVGVSLGARLPAGPLLVPLVAGAALQLGGLLQITLPHWLLVLAYGVIGCYIGLRFDRASLAYVGRHLPAMLVSALGLILSCALFAWALAAVTGMDFLSLYLATSPGGLDAMAIIAVDTHSDVGLVLAMQTLRLFVVLFSGVSIARLVIRLSHA